MERLIIVVDCPDEWRELGWVDPERVRQQITASLLAWFGYGAELPVRVRWQSLDADTERGAQR